MIQMLLTIAELIIASIELLMMVVKNTGKKEKEDVEFPKALNRKPIKKRNMKTAKVRDDFDEEALIGGTSNEEFLKLMALTEAKLHHDLLYEKYREAKLASDGIREELF